MTSFSLHIANELHILIYMTICNQSNPFQLLQPYFKEPIGNQEEECENAAAQIFPAVC